MLAYDYPLIGMFWTMFIFFLWMAWIILLFRVFADLFRSDMSGWAKGLWSIFVIIVPIFGVLIYLIAHGSSMAERNIAEAQERDEQFRSYVRETTGSGGSSAAELSQLAELHGSGVLSDAEFEAQKAKILNR